MRFHEGDRAIGTRLAGYFCHLHRSFTQRKPRLGLLRRVIVVQNVLRNPAIQELLASRAWVVKLPSLSRIIAFR